MRPKTAMLQRSGYIFTDADDFIAEIFPRFTRWVKEGHATLVDEVRDI